ncbi:MAG TPA: SDR family oxidoreductase [Anaerolineae bacterium]|nr:SDR family oxidoreductase [Anaerolineae bacterium]
MNLQDKVVVVTGASSGIGIEIARALGGERMSLVLAARRAEKLEDVAEELAELGVPIEVIATDVTREAECEALVATTLATYGRLDVLVNNAGYGPPAPLLELDEALWDVTIDTCLKGVYLMTRAVMPTMLAQGGGAVVNISSVAGKEGFARRTAYCAAKWGLHGFTAALRAELGEQNIRAHLICPGAVATPWWEKANDEQPDEVMEKMIQPAEVAEAVRWVLTQPERLQIDEVVVRTYRSPWD